jgi:DNA-binding response OmpR family regulator
MTCRRELIQRIRTDPALCATPVILLTALAAPEPTMRALAAGAHEYIVKPFTARELIARIESQLDLARLRTRYPR